MPFRPRRTQPMRPESYLRIALALRARADAIKAAAPGETPQQKRILTMHLASLAHEARHWNQRHRATIDGTLMMPPRDKPT